MKNLTNFDDLVTLLTTLEKRKLVAIACPSDEHTEYIVSRGLREGIADFLLVCSGKCKKEFKKLYSLYPKNVTIYEEEAPDEAAIKAVSLVREKKADVLMKGTINTDNLLRAVLNKEKGLLESGHTLTHIAVAKIPTYNKLLVFTDAAVIPYPTLEQFDAMISYSTLVCHKMGILCPNVALIHCTEKVSEKFSNTLDYLELIKRAEQGAYGNVCLYGPMDVKTACDKESGELKGILSKVVGEADILIFPDIQAGNVFYKTITLFSNAQIAGILAGTTSPVVVTSRADSNESKYYSLALACFMQNK